MNGEIIERNYKLYFDVADKLHQYYVENKISTAYKESKKFFKRKNIELDKLTFSHILFPLYIKTTYMNEIGKYLSKGQKSDIYKIFNNLISGRDRGYEVDWE